ncbi:MAG: DNA-binding protein [Carboxylicivirga sp.]|jgi:predicted histone-like DNA-binding protein|nr:DNA-binding protein [Carboxylicivirga sp.]
MAIKYKVIQRGQPGVAGGGEQKFYASANVTGKQSLEDLTELIELTSTVSGADIRAVLYSMVKVMQKSLSNGQLVELGELGSLRVSLSSNGEETEEDVTSNSIKSAKVVFRPGKDIQKLMKTLKFEKKAE